MAYLLRDAYNRQIPIMTTIHLGTDPSNQIILSKPPGGVFACHPLGRPQWTFHP